RDGLAQRDKWFVLKIRAHKHFFERRHQLPGQRSFDLQSQVAPATGNSIAIVLSGDVEPANECHAPITNEQLTMVADSKPVQGEGVELPDFCTLGAQRFK